MQPKTTAIIALTKHGSELGWQLHQQLAHSHLYVPERFAKGNCATGYTGSVKDVVAQAFTTYDALLLIMATGVAVRSIAPWIADKRTDPAIVVMDERGQFAISLLSGHLGGANELAQEVARRIGAQPVITTASDIQKTLSVDLLGREFGWRIELSENITRVSAAIVNGEKVGIVQECGETSWWPESEPLPANLHMFDCLESLKRSDCVAGLIISARNLKDDLGNWQDRIVVYRPRCLVIGIGMHRGTPYDAVASAISMSLAEAGLAPECLHSLATVVVRKDEPGLITFAEEYNLPIHAFTKEQLNSVRVANPSEVVYRYLGVWGVCEAAAQLGTRTDELLVTKRRHGNVTIAIGMKDDSGK